MLRLIRCLHHLSTFNIAAQRSQDYAKARRLLFRNQLIGWSILIPTLLTWSSMGAVLLKLHGVKPLLKSAWRNQMTVFALIGLLAFQMGQQYYRTGTVWVRRTFIPHKKSVSIAETEEVQVPSWARFFLVCFACSVCQVAFNALWIWSLSNTTVAHSYLFGNCQTLVIIAGLWLFRQEVSIGETIGALIGFAGAGMALIDIKSDKASVTWEGDLAAFGSSLALVGFLFAVRALRQSGLPLSYYMLPMVLMCTVMLAGVAAVVEGVTMGADPQTGMFGWANGQWALIVLYLVFIGGLIGNTGYVSAMGYVPALLVSIVMLLEPILAVPFSIAMDVGSAPGVWTICGGLVAVFGTGIVTYASHRRSVREIEAEHAE
eukprot:Opistho-2@88842